MLGGSGEEESKKALMSVDAENEEKVPGNIVDVKMQILDVFAAEQIDQAMAAAASLRGLSDAQRDRQRIPVRYHAPKLFIARSGWGRQFFVERRKLTVDEAAVLKAIPGAREARRGFLNGEEGMNLAFLGETEMWKAYIWCREHATDLHIIFAAGRGKVELGGVTQNPGKLTIRNVYGRSQSEAREEIRRILLAKFTTLASPEFFQHSIFEKFIEVVPSRERLEWYDKISFTCYVYFTSREYAAQAAEFLHGKTSHSLVPYPMKVYGIAAQRCTSCERVGHLAKDCPRVGLRCTFSQLCNVTLREHLKAQTKCIKITVGANGGREVNWAYLWFEDGKSRLNSIAALAELKQEGTLLEYPIECTQPLTECWRCGAIDAVEQALGREGHNGDQCPTKKTKESQAEIYRETKAKRKNTPTITQPSADGFFSPGDPRSGSL